MVCSLLSWTNWIDPKLDSSNGSTASRTLVPHKSASRAAEKDDAVQWNK